MTELVNDETSVGHVVAVHATYVHVGLFARARVPYRQARASPSAGRVGHENARHPDIPVEFDARVFLPGRRRLLEGPDDGLRHTLEQELMYVLPSVDSGHLRPAAHPAFWQSMCRPEHSPQVYGQQSLARPAWAQMLLLQSSDEHTHFLNLLVLSKSSHQPCTWAPELE
eukprot:CAMPEP_0195160454 /NCGR_PEP_ID=MMETSP0448-20130528/186674_1 /TAXON_ID=66468 /ORGANISM="Heterocapsa triquestra, Strain CCMP 448" /LENGTH=168 /DNA_ID=CAMNT_0040199255 /DNA_START=943 /DNA_END=1450 /DNA_ORIENTATION=+